MAPDTTHPDPVAAYLAEVRKRAAYSARYEFWENDDVPRLLAAVEAVLALHKPDGTVGEYAACGKHMRPLTEALRREMIACPDCDITESPRCWHAGCPDEWPCPTYRAIASALTGEAKPGEH